MTIVFRSTVSVRSNKNKKKNLKIRKVRRHKKTHYHSTSTNSIRSWLELKKKMMKRNTDNVQKNVGDWSLNCQNCKISKKNAIIPIQQ